LKNCRQQQARVITEIRAASLVKKIFSFVLPDLTNVGLDELLEFRHREQESLRAFRVEANKLKEEIESNVWDSGYERAIAGIVDRDVQPRLREFRVHLEGLLRKQISESIGSQLCITKCSICGASVCCVAVLRCTVACGIGDGRCRHGAIAYYRLFCRKIRGKKEKHANVFI
jgi:hypothetical protein